MRGDPDDMLGRIKAVLPDRWFGDTTPIVDAVLAGPAHLWSAVHALIGEARRQARLRSSSGAWLDALVADFLGDFCSRRPGEVDETYRDRAARDLFRERGTRRAVFQVLLDLTGREPAIFEPARPSDTGAYVAAGALGCHGLAYGLTGGWGSLDHPHQLFVTAYRPLGAVGLGGLGWGAGGYNLGPIAYSDTESIRGHVSDTDIRRAIASVLPIGAIAWTRVSG